MNGSSSAAASRLISAIRSCLLRGFRWASRCVFPNRIFSSAGQPHFYNGDHPRFAFCQGVGRQPVDGFFADPIPGKDRHPVIPPSWSIAFPKKNRVPSFRAISAAWSMLPERLVLTSTS